MILDVLFWFRLNLKNANISNSYILIYRKFG